MVLPPLSKMPNHFRLNDEAGNVELRFQNRRIIEDDQDCKTIEGVLMKPIRE